MKSKNRLTITWIIEGMNNSFAYFIIKYRFGKYQSVLPVKDLDGPEIKALLTQISALPVVSKILEPAKDDRRETWTLEPAHFYTGGRRPLYLRSARPSRNKGCSVCRGADAPYKGLTPLAPLRGYPSPRTISPGVLFCLY